MTNKLPMPPLIIVALSILLLTASLVLLFGTPPREDPHRLQVLVDYRYATIMEVAEALEDTESKQILYDLSTKPVTYGGDKIRPSERAKADVERWLRADRAVDESFKELHAQADGIQNQLHELLEE